MSRPAVMARPAGAAAPTLSGAAAPVSLCEVLDRLLDTGVVASGDVMITVADVDLVYLSLRLLLSSVETARKAGAGVPFPARPEGPQALPTGTPPPQAAIAPAPAPAPAPALAPARAPAPAPAPPPAPPAPALAPRPAAIPTIVGPDPLPAPRHPGGQMKMDPENVKNGLAQLVLVVVRLLHELLEKQAVKRIDGGSLTDEQIERLGTTLMLQAQELRRLQTLFGFDDEEMNLDLGPLGKLI